MGVGHPRGVVAGVGFLRSQVAVEGAVLSGQLTSKQVFQKGKGIVVVWLLLGVVQFVVERVAEWAYQ